MKIFLTIFALALATFFTASAQVTVEVMLDQGQFLPGETLPVAVRITNRSGQPLHLGADAGWLTFSVESADGQIVVKNGDVPVQGGFDVQSSQAATKRVDLAPYFTLTQIGHYRVTATVRIKDWAVQMTSRPQSFDVIHGAELWSQVFGLPASGPAANRPPETRKYTLEEANYLRSQLRLYVQVSDEAEARVFKVATLGTLVSFSQPQPLLDHSSNLHVIWQSGAAVFTYVMVDPDGKILKQELFDYMNIRPRLRLNDAGDITVIGGVRRIKPGEMPDIQAPVEIPAPPKP